MRSNSNNLIKDQNNITFKRGFRSYNEIVKVIRSIQHELKKDTNVTASINDNVRIL